MHSAVAIVLHAPSYTHDDDALLLNFHIAALPWLFVSEADPGGVVKMVSPERRRASILLIRRESQKWA